jgi:hypothetical protein
VQQRCGTWYGSAGLATAAVRRRLNPWPQWRQSSDTRRPQLKSGTSDPRLSGMSRVRNPAPCPTPLSKAATMFLRVTRCMLLLAGLLFVPAAAAAQNSSPSVPADSTLRAVLASVRPHVTMIRVDLRGSGSIQGMSAGLQDDVLLVWPAPKRRVPLEMVEALHVRRSNLRRNTLGGAVAGGLIMGLVLHNFGGMEDTRIRSYATGAVLGGFTGFGLSLGNGAWERVYIRSDPAPE